MRRMINALISLLPLLSHAAGTADLTPRITVESTPLSDIPGLGLFKFPQGYGNGTSGDFNGDGYQDVVFYTDQSNLGTSPDIVAPLAMYYFNPTKKAYDRANPSIIGGDLNSGFIRQMFAEDVNGDGITDFWAVNANEYNEFGRSGTPFYGGNQYFYISNGPGSFIKTDMGVGHRCAHGVALLSNTNGVKRYALSTSFSTQAYGDPYLFVSTYQAQTQTFSSRAYTGNDPFFIEPLGPYSMASQRRPGYFYLAGLDVNSDGNTDIVGLSSISGENSVYISDGNGDYRFATKFDTGLPPTVDVVGVAVGDFNGDKIEDMLLFANDYRQPVVSRNPSGGNPIHFYRVMIGNGLGGFTDQTNAWLQPNDRTYTTTYNQFFASDLNGDGYSDIVRIRAINEDPGYPYVLDVLTSNGSAFTVTTFSAADLAVDKNRAWMANLMIPVGKNKFLYSSGRDTYNATFTVSYGTPDAAQNPVPSTPQPAPFQAWPEYPAPNSSVTISVKGQSGSVASEPIGIECGSRCSYQFTKGSTITLTAVPDSGHRIKNWGGACGGNKPTCRLKLNSFNKKVTLTFK